MENCDSCSHSSNGLDCNLEIETLSCCENEREHEVKPIDACDMHQFIDVNRNDGILGYDCDENEINEFRILRFPFSADIENWDEEPNIDPRFYCLVRSSMGEVFAISVYDDWFRDRIRKFEKLNGPNEIPISIKSVSEMSYYEVAFSGITGDEWYYDRNRDELRQKLDSILKEQKGLAKKLTKNH